MKFIEALRFGDEILKSNKLHKKLDTELLLSETIRRSREYILLNLNKFINKKQISTFKSYIEKRKQKVPIAYILGSKEFWKYKFLVNNSVLIPRPETEQIIEESLKLLKKDDSKKILDIGTGSGCIAISLKKERPNSVIDAIDVSKSSIKVAKSNAKMHHLLNKINFINIDIDKFKSNNYDLILSNPPYINKVDYSRLDDNVKLYEPKVALFGGVSGFKVINKVITKSKELLKVNGKLILEIGDKQRNYSVSKLNEKRFYINKICKDYSGKFRIIISTKLN